MNIISTMVGISVMGVAAPSMMQMSLAPHEAQLRAKNLGVAETAAVVFAATYEGSSNIPPSTQEPCTSALQEGTENAYSVTCTHGSGKYVKSVTRAFRLAICDDYDANNGHGNSGGYDCSNPGNSGFVNNERVFEFPSPPGFSAHQCLPTDNWGLDTTAFNRTKNKWNGPSCTPNAAWNPTAYLASDPNAWMYDINGEKGFGDHPDY